MVSSVEFGDFSGAILGFLFYKQIREVAMQKEIIIKVDLNDEHEAMLENIRWKHFDIEGIIKEELMEQIEEIIRVYGEMEGAEIWNV